jgi:hypothetical protein
MSSMIFLNMLKDIDHGFIQSGTSIETYTLNDVIETVNRIVGNNNAVESARIKNIKFDEDFIKYAEMKGSSE